MAKFDTCVVLLNPDSTGYEQALEQVKVIKEQFIDEQFFQHTLVPQDYTSNKQLLTLLKHLGPESLLVIGAGDGTINTLLNRLQDKRLPKGCRETTILPLWGGNASDMAHMLNGHHRTNIRKILDSGERIAVYPMEVQLNKDKKQLAMAYVSIGAVAKTAQILDSSSLVSSKGFRRWFRFPLEAYVGLKGMTTSTAFQVELDGRAKYVFDIVCLNGSRIAKVYRSPAKLHKPGFLALVIAHKHPALLTHLVTLTGAWLKPRFQHELTLKVLEPTQMQLDGEIIALAGETNVSVQQSTQPMYVLSTKL